ncbi:hypothetical protein ACTOV4_10215 [Brucella sp. C7-11G]
MTNITSNSDEANLYIGIANLNLQCDQIVLPYGIHIERTFAHIMSPIMMAFALPKPNGHHPAPWKAVQGGFDQDISTQIIIPKTAGKTHAERMLIASTVTLLLRLWYNPAITMIAGSNTSFSTMKEAPETTTLIFPIQFQQRKFQISMVGSDTPCNNLDWITDNLGKAIKLMKESADFQLAASAIDTGQFIENQALTMVSLWGALEAIFSPDKRELRFRVSALIASYIYPTGQERHTSQKRIAKLYDKRSAAAHGKPSHSNEDLLATFEILRGVLIKFIQEGRVPTKEELEERMFGVES